MRPDDAEEGASPEAILRARAELLAAPLTDDREESATSIIMHIGAHRVAVPLQRVRTVAAAAPVADIPRARHLLVGARLIGGEVIALTDLGAVLGGPSDSPFAARAVVVLDSLAAPLGVLADRVTNVEIDVETATDETATDGASASGLIAGISRDGVLLLDVDAALGDPRFMTAADTNPQRSPEDETKGPS